MPTPSEELVSPARFAEELRSRTREEIGGRDPGAMTRATVTYYARQGLIPGARQDAPWVSRAGGTQPGRWWIPLSAPLLPSPGSRYAREQERAAHSSISAAEYARRHKKSRERARQVLERGDVPGAVKEDGIWRVPIDAPWPEPRKPGKQPTTKEED